MTTLPEGSDPSWLIAAGVDSSAVAAQTEKITARRDKGSEWERLMGYAPLDWADKDLSRLLDFLMDKTSAEMQTFASWSRRQFSTFDPVKARRYPRQVMELWPQAFPVFETSKPPKYVEDDSQFVIAPRLQKNG